LRREAHVLETAPDLSLVIPCYNEKGSLRATITELVGCFAVEHVKLQLVLVDNGSTDGTGEIIDALIDEGLPITKVTIPVNEGYGNGIIRGFQHCQAPLAGFTHADGQIPPEGVLTIYRLMLGREGRVLAKARRRFRQDSWQRKVVSGMYNALMLATFGWLGAIDINASPKILSRENLIAMQLTSKDWFLDPEMMIKAKHLGLRVIEADIEGRPRQGGKSKVRWGAMLEFLKNILAYRVGRPLTTWRNSVKTVEAIERLESLGSQAGLAPGVISLRISDTSPEGAPRSAQGDIGRRGKEDVFDRVRLLEQRRFEDSRGFLQKVLTASQCEGNLAHGEIYVSTAYQGEVKGNHYHHRMGEWFAIIQGEGRIELCDPQTGERQTVPISSRLPSSLYVPAGLAHAIVNTGEEPLICVAVADTEHDAHDVVPFEVYRPPRRAVRREPAPLMEKEA
jgi:glycosyltransferase involved in cell wall biosynthesis